MRMAVRAQQQCLFRYRPPAIRVAEERVFLTRDGRRMTRNTVHRFVKRLSQQAGIRRMHAQRFRHSTGVAFLRSGASETVPQSDPDNPPVAAVSALMMSLRHADEVGGIIYLTKGAEGKAFSWWSRPHG